MRRVFLVVVLLSASLPLAAEEEVAAQDQLVAEIVRMLESRVSESIIDRWLETSSRRPGPLNSEDLIALTRAGASEGLVERLLDLAAAPIEVEAPLAQPADVGGPPPREPDAESPISPASTAGVPQEAATRADRITAHVSVEYHTASVEEEERPWDLFIYLDGAFLARVPPNKKDPVRFAQPLTPGHHRLVATQERHRSRSGKKRRWSHEARVSPAPLDFELTDGAEVKIEIVFRQRFFERPGSGPLNLTIMRGYEELQRLESVGEPPGLWPLLCEEIEANYVGEDKLPLAARQDLKRCVRWPDLWPEALAGGGRGAVREHLEQFDFAPPPANEIQSSR